MICDRLEPLIEGFADGTLTPSAEDLAHLGGCPACAARLGLARSIEHWLAARPEVQPPAAFTSAVLARVGHEQWEAERVVDLGFNLAVAAGLLIVIAGAAGLAWSLGSLTITVDLDALRDVASTVLAERVRSQVQTIGLAAALLTMTLGLWWWAEADHVL